MNIYAFSGAEVFTNPFREMEEAEAKVEALKAKKLAEVAAAVPSNPEYKVLDVCMGVPWR